MPVEGMPRAEYRRRKFGSAEYAAALDARVTGVAAEVGLAFDLGAQARTPNTLPAHRLIRFAGRNGRQDEVVEALFSAYFSAGLDVGDPAILTRVAVSCGMEREVVSRFLAGDEDATEVRAEDEAIRRAGIGGVPFFRIGDEAVNGAQPVAVFTAILSQALSRLPASDGDCSDGLCRA
jgi:predicted DsbA family dithiol-disulfide isomerase